MKVMVRDDSEGMVRLSHEVQQVPSVAHVPMTLRYDCGQNPSIATCAIVAMLICIPDNTHAFAPTEVRLFSP
jgi:hypothetical protein